MAKISSHRLESCWLFAAMGCVSLGSLSCGDSNSPPPPAGQPGVVAPSSTPAPPVPTVTVTPTATPTVMPVPYPVPYPYPVPIPSRTSYLPQGEYGGENVRVTVSYYDVSFAFACAVGSVSYSIPLDSQGDFDVQGSYQSQVGPPPHGGYPSYPARFFGFLRNGHLHFDVAYKDDHGHLVDLKYDAFYGNPPDFTQLCAYVAPMASPTSQSSPQPSPSGSPSGSP